MILLNLGNVVFFRQVGSANTNQLQLFGPSIQSRHCLVSLMEGVCTVTPLHADALTFVNGHHIQQPTILHVSKIKQFHISTVYFANSNNSSVKSDSFNFNGKFHDTVVRLKIYLQLKPVENRWEI